METDDRIVVAQLLALAGLGWPGPPRWSLPRPLVGTGVAVGAAGAVLAALGATAHGSRLTARVEPPAGAELLDHGVYRLSRNPIYAGLLLAGAAAALLRRRPEPIVAWGALATVLNLKVRREEQRLLDRFGVDYTAYARTAPRFLGRRSLSPSRPPGPGPG